MHTFRFRALLTLDPPAPGHCAERYPSGTHALMIHVHQHAGLPCDKYLSAEISLDGEQPLVQGEQAVVTVKVTDDDAPSYLAIGQPFTVWGGCAGHGIVSRRVFTTGQPS